MSLDTATAPTTSHFQRKLLCWRERECEDYYDCSIKAVGEGAVMVEFDSEWIEFSAAVAYELAFYLAEAVAIVEQSSAETTRAVARENEPLLERKYRLFMDWHLDATGEIQFDRISPQIMPDREGYTAVSIRTVRPGGVEVEFEGFGYAFSKDDAAWISEKLLEASGQQLEIYPRYCLFETLRRQGHNIHG